jgi:chemotaxis protein methyltransferase CheR
VTDRSFNEFHAIVCRNVLIYFDPQLQAHVHELFWQSLAPLGVLALGRRESVRHVDVTSRYADVDPREKIYRRIS